MKPRRKIVVGLGNPGEEYAKTYHNVGALALPVVRKRLEDSGAKITFIAPAAFMNESGAAVHRAMKKAGARPEDLVVIHDDSDLPVGAYQIASGKSSAGHKGVQSVMDALGTKDFIRVRIGIRPARERTRKKASAFVLKKITARDEKALRGVFEEIAEALSALLGEPEC